MGKYICWYAYKGHETEGHLHLEEPECFEANSAAEALYKYLCMRAWREKKEPYHKSLTEHMKSEYSSGGWGFMVKELAETEYVNPNEMFYNQYYHKYNK
ncbi:MAG: hypothetical protein V4547_17050 [Bacteroidota bacterium]